MIEPAAHDIPVDDGIVRLHAFSAVAGHRTPLICLHPAPMDGSYFSDFADFFSKDRGVIAPDYPGYGASTPPKTPPGIEDYATALLAALNDFCRGDTIHLLGFHTGCLVAAEMALLTERIQQLILIDVPFFGGNEQQEKYSANFSADDSSTWGFGAAFSYPCEDKLAQINNAVLTIGSGGSLGAPTRQAAEILPNAEHKSLPHITAPVFANGGQQLADLIDGFLRD